MREYRKFIKGSGGAEKVMEVEGMFPSSTEWQRKLTEGPLAALKSDSSSQKVSQQ